MNDSEKSMVKTIAGQLRKKGFPHTADYVEMFGLGSMNPSFTKGPTKESEAFYAKCVEEGHPWDWYFEFPEDAIF